jgi:uncharacterized protein YlzI (FlbEa/FlbD family)
VPLQLFSPKGRKLPSPTVFISLLSGTSHFGQTTILRTCLFLEKLFFKFFYIYLLLKKLINGKHFPVKKKFDLISRKILSLLVVFILWKVVSGKPLSKLFCVCLSLEKLVNGKHFTVKEKFGVVFRKVFS